MLTRLYLAYAVTLSGPTKCKASDYDEVVANAATAIANDDDDDDVDDASIALILNSWLILTLKQYSHHIHLISTNVVSPFCVCNILNREISVEYLIIMYA